MAILSINIDRLRRDIDNLARFTRGPGPGVTRLTFSEEDRAARAYLRDQMEAIGLRVVELPPGIMIGRLESTTAGGPSVMDGSHSDSVLQGGRVDGTLVGIANHAGATPMARRRDALAGAAQLMAELERFTPTLGAHTVCTVGQIACSPGARNVIPGEVRLSIDFRDIENLDVKWAKLASYLEEIATRRGLKLALGQVAGSEPVSLAPPLQDLLDGIVVRRGLAGMRMPRGP